MNRRLLVPIALVASLTVAGLAGCQAAVTAPASSSAASGSTTTAVLPVDSNPIVNASTVAGLTIVSAAAEDNVDPVTNAAIDDRLQVTVRNDTTSELTSFEVYYVMTDVTTGQSEAYYQALPGFTLAAGATGTLSFDGESGPGHFPENTFSLYRSSKNQVDFTIEVSAAGVQVANATATKGSGEGDAAD
ncbi:hypothetical protein [Microcella frigidaquae]|uniref:DUF4352 domain-containing protein n=1 Tax=Microcella frigidaquae TaxID=424758 RepID=A0A840X952_9MICO|nr:hypothetical protein [Microcella frigidaquae]MBB5617615.1 hypothetical protein [Microcella frigidaquae]NHN45930.1 hypothetical protein [Microcella frigidaquae]